MRPLLSSSLLLASALAAPDVLAPFEPAITSSPRDLGAIDVDQLFARQNANACATNYYNCGALGAPGLCCPRTAICSADANRAVACCPQGAVCTGALGVSVTTTASPNPTATAGGFVPAATTTGDFTQSSNAGSSVRSTVQNAFYPFPAIPTTYSNAAACSAAYTSCQGDAAACTTALANGDPGVTIQAPNGGGATITPVPSVGLQSAQSICASLSSLACSGLQVEACRSFGGEQGAATRVVCGGGYWMGAGAAAVGIAGGWV